MGNDLKKKKKTRSLTQLAEFLKEQSFLEEAKRRWNGDPSPEHRGVATGMRIAASEVEQAIAASKEVLDRQIAQMQENGDWAAAAGAMVAYETLVHGVKEAESQ